MSKRRSKLTRKAVERIAAEWHKLQPAWLGDHVSTQVVETGIPGMYYARLANGKVVEVRNTQNVPPRFDLHVQIGENRHHPGVWQIVRINEDYDRPAGAGEVAYHRAQHEEGGGDRLALNRKQITALTVRVFDGTGFIVSLYGDVAITPNGLVQVDSQNIDLSGLLGSDNAVFVSVECDDSGTISLHKGSDFGSPYAATVNNVPVPDQGKYLIAYILLYAGQTELLDEHIHVPMPLGSTYFGNMMKSVYDTDDDGIVDEAEHALSADVAGDQGRYLAVYNYFIGSGTIAYHIGLAKSADGRSWRIATEPIIDFGAGAAWDSQNHQFPKILSVNGVLYLFYSGRDSLNWEHFKIGLARSFDGGQTWEKYSGNPILNNNVAWENANVFCPVVLHDVEETDPSRRWKMWYAGSSFGQGVGYAYSADGLSWTKAAGNPVLVLGTSGQWDDTYITPSAVIRRGNEYILIYSGKSGFMWQSGIARFTDPEGTYTKDANNPIIGGDGITASLTANLTAGSTTASVSDATIFPIGCPIWVYNGNLGSTNHYLTRVVARNSSTSLELADAAPVTITSGGTVRSIAYNSINVMYVRYDDGYMFGITAFQADPSETGVHELTMLAYADDNLSEIRTDYGAGVQIPISLAESQAQSVTRENWSVLDTQEAENRRKPAGQSVTFNDGEGNPADVTSGPASAGTSEYAARRDHVHHTDATGGQYRQFVYDVVSDEVIILTEDGDALYVLLDLE